MAAVALPQDLRERVALAEGKTLIAGIRPESFEDASLVDSHHLERGTRFDASIDLVESMGAELQSDQLRELAEDSAAGEVPRSGEEGIHLFEADTGDSLTA